MEIKTKFNQNDKVVYCSKDGFIKQGIVQRFKIEKISFKLVITYTVISKNITEEIDETYVFKTVDELLEFSGFSVNKIKEDETLVAKENELVINQDKSLEKITLGYTVSLMMESFQIRNSFINYNVTVTGNFKNNIGEFFDCKIKGYDNDFTLPIKILTDNGYKIV